MSEPEVSEPRRGGLSDEGDQGPQMPDLGALLSKLGEVQQSLQEAQASAAAELVEGSAGGGAVRIQATGDLEFRQVVIDPSVVDPNEIEMLQDLVLAAIREVVDQAHAAAAEALGGFDLGGGLGGLGGLLGQ